MLLERSQRRTNISLEDRWADNEEISWLESPLRTFDKSCNRALQAPRNQTHLSCWFVPEALLSCRPR
jgi:hypothetical protein